MSLEDFDRICVVSGPRRLSALRVTRIRVLITPRDGICSVLRAGCSVGVRRAVLWEKKIKMFK